MTTRRPRPGTARRLRLERMEDRAVPASLSVVDVNGDASDMRLTYTADPGESNVLTVTVSGGNYVFNDPLAAGITAAGMTGSGTPTVSVPTAGIDSIAIDLGDGADVLNLRSAADNLTVTSSGDLAVNLSSNAPANTGTVAGILGHVTVSGSGGGANGLVVGNAGGAGVTATVAHNQVSGMLFGGKLIGFTNVGSLRVSTSNTAADAVTVAVASGSMAIRVDTNGGADTVAVEATSGATAVNTGAGNDAVTVGDAVNGLDDVAGGLTVDAGAGAANSLTVTDYASAGANTVAVSASQIVGFAPATITYRSVGGAYGAGGGITLQGSDAAADGITLGGASAAHLFTVNGNGGADTVAVQGNIRAALNGGAGADTFDLGTDGATLTGAIDGGADSNTLTYSGRTGAVGVTLTGTAAGTGTGTTGGFAGIDSLVGGNAADTLTGRNAANAWFITGADTGHFGVGPVFSGWENLTGGSGDDTFSFAFGPANGSVSGSISGGAGGSDQLNYAGVPTAVAVTLTGAAAGTASRIGGTFSGIDVLTGKDTASTLTGADAANVWTVNGTNDGSIAGGPAFYDFDNLTGGSGNDTFNYAAGTGKTTGTVTGGGGTTDSVRFAGYAGGITVNLQSAAASKSADAASVVAALSGINDYQGTAGGGDLLVGPNAARTWTVNAADGGTVGAVGFGGFENLTGGTAADTFTFTDAGSVSGVIDGKGGTDTLDLSARTGAVAVTLYGPDNGGTAAVAGGFIGVDAHTGNGSQSTLTGYSVAGGSPVANTWTVTGTDAGSLTDGVGTTAFGGYAHLAGGAGDDTFVFAGGGAGKTTGSVAAGAGSVGSLQFQGYTGGVTVNLQSAAASKTAGGASVLAAFSGINDVESNAATGDTLVGPDAITNWAVSAANAGTVAGVAFRAMENLRGGSAADTFAIGAAGSLAGAADGGAGANVINYSATAGVKSITFTGLGSSAGFDGTGNLITGGFQNVSAITANAGTTNALTGRNAAATWTVDDDNGNATYASGGRTFTLAGFQVLTGGGMTDTFNVLSTASGRIWTLRGGSGDDSFAVSNLDDQLGVLTLAGGAGTDSIAVDDGGNGNAASWALAGGNVTRDAVSLDYGGFEHTDVTTGTGAVAVLIESTAVGHTLTVNAGGSSNDISVGLVSNKYDLAAGVTVNLTNAASTDTLTIDDTGATPGAAEWTLSGSGVGRSGAAAIALTGTMESMSVTAGHGGVTGNSFDVTASASTAFVVSGGAGSADSLTVHDDAMVGTDDGISQVTFTGGLQAVAYYDFDLSPVVVD